MNLKEQCEKELGIEEDSLPMIEWIDLYIGWLEDRCNRRCDGCRWWTIDNECGNVNNCFGDRPMADAQCPRWEAK